VDKERPREEEEKEMVDEDRAKKREGERDGENRRVR